MSCLAIRSLGRLPPLSEQTRPCSAKIIWDSLMRRAEQQLTRVKVDIIRCHSPFLPNTQWVCFSFKPFPLVYSTRKRRGKKSLFHFWCASLWRVERPLLNAVEIVTRPSRLILYSCLVFLCSRSGKTGRFTERSCEKTHSEERAAAMWSLHVWYKIKYR